MKYIRTKSNIYELNADVYVKNNEAFMRWFSNGEELDPDSLGKVIKQADSIVDLCDAIVIIDKTGTPIVFEGLRQELKRIVATMDNPIATYGCIWTSNGLIYVAKMDANGDLELI